MSDSIGSVEELVAAREARGVSAEDMIRQLKLHPRQLDAIERGDWKALPGLPFVRGTIRGYGRVLGVQVEPLLESIGGYAKPADLRARSRLEAPMPPTSMFGFGSGGSGSRWIWGVLVVVGLFALALFFGRNGDLSDLSSWVGGTSGERADAGASRSASGADRGRTEPVAIPGTRDPAGARGTSAAAPSSAGGGSAPGPGSATAGAAGGAGSPVAAGATGAGTAAGTGPGAAAGAATGAPVAAGGTQGAVAGAGAAGGAGAAAGAGAAGASQAAAAGGAAAAARAPNLRLKFDADSWVNIRQADGKVLLYGTQKSQTVSELEAVGPVTMTIGNAAKVQLEYMNKPVPLKPQPGSGIAKVSLP